MATSRPTAGGPVIGLAIGILAMVLVTAWFISRPRPAEQEPHQDHVEKIRGAGGA